MKMKATIKPETALLSEPQVRSSAWLEDLERALTKINEAEGYLLLGKIASGKNMLGDGKAILEEILERESKSSNDPSSATRLSEGHGRNAFRGLEIGSSCS